MQLINANISYIALALGLYALVITYLWIAKSSEYKKVKSKYRQLKSIEEIRIQKQYLGNLAQEAAAVSPTGVKVQSTVHRSEEELVEPTVVAAQEIAEGYPTFEITNLVETKEEELKEVVITTPEPIKMMEVPSIQEFTASCLTGGAFKNLRSLKDKSHSTPYIISKEAGQYTFHIDFENQGALAHAIQHRDSYIDGFCEVLNSYSPEMKSITAISGSQGRLVVEGDELRVVQKIQIKYI